MDSGRTPCHQHQIKAGTDSIDTSRNAVRWKPISTWDQGGAWAYRTPREWWSPMLLMSYSAFLALDIQANNASAGKVTISSIAAGVAWTMLLGAVAAWNRTYTEVDAEGITVVNVFRTHRVRWSDIDLVQLDGRPAITLLTKDRRITCWALNQRPGDLLPWSRLVRRQCFEATVDWMRNMSVAQRSSGDRAADYRRN